VGFLQPILHLPYAYLWLPGLAFIVVAGGFYWFSRPARVHADVPADAAPVKPSIAKKPPDQRESSRRQGNTVEVHVAPPDNKTDPGVASVLDRSMGGMRLALYHEIEAGTVLSIRPTHADEMVPWVDIEVRSCKPSTEMPGRFEVGCQYVKSPPYSIQLLFG
jgi:hypothetical protein